MLPRFNYPDVIRGLWWELWVMWHHSSEYLQRANISPLGEIKALRCVTCWCWDEQSIIFHMWIWYFLRAIRSSKLPLCIVQWGRNLKFLENPFKILQGRDICRFYLFGQMIAYLQKDRDVGAKPIINLIVDLSRLFKYTFWLAAAIRLFHWNKRLNKNNTNNWLDLCF